MPDDRPIFRAKGLAFVVSQDSLVPERRLETGLISLIGL
jgi:hypothetical protein